MTVPTPVIWLTGYSGAGKTTIAYRLKGVLEKDGYRIQVLDGDEIRSLFPRTGFTREDRISHIKRVAHMASLLSSHHVVTIVSLISPYEEARAFARSICPAFVEVYLKTPLGVCEKRDVKGLYKQARQGKLKNFTGFDLPYEVPKNPELSIDTQHTSPLQCARMIAQFSFSRQAGFETVAPYHPSVSAKIIGFPKDRQLTT